MLYAKFFIEELKIWLKLQLKLVKPKYIAINPFGTLCFMKNKTSV